MKTLFSILFLLLLTACSPKKFYTLGEGLNIQHTATNNETIEVVKVRVPKYLKEHKVVRQITPYQIELLHKAEWLIPMEKRLTEIFINYLQQSMNNPKVYLYPWDSDKKSSKRISINIQKFIASNTEVTLIANYKILNLNTKEQSIKNFETRVATTEDISKMMQSMEKAYVELLEEIRESISYK